MKHLITPMLLIVTIVSAHTAAGATADPMCATLRDFVASLRPGETKKLTFHTLWGSNFKGKSEPSISTTACAHSDDLPAKAVCKYLTEHASVEFSGNNVKRALSCLSTRTRFDPSVELNEGVFSLSYGSSSRGSLVTIKFEEDT